ncbi:MAG: hypothetical protein B6A08_00470 [Sorangiineae bacterium NIC37A_2]|jgi:hypothetical protein|nr:MAG: hypothetical protein B6A08_00470 [Sorangiineae bacterium NIC37A_2]
MRSPSGKEKHRPRKKPRVTVEDTRASLSRTLIVAGVGLALGIAWPWIVGISLVPEPPISDGSARSEQEASGQAQAQVTEAKEISATDLLEISEPVVTSCRDQAGKAQSDCQGIDFDALLHGPLLTLVECPAAQGVFGTLSIGVEISFAERKIAKVESGRSTNLPKLVAQELLLCAEKRLTGISLDTASAPHASYTVYYKILFKTPEIAASEAETITLASGTATVLWRSALVREEPNGESKVRTRVLAGARLTVTGRMGDWYRVKYDASGREGWVHGAALGLLPEK